MNDIEKLNQAKIAFQKAQYYLSKSDLNKAKYYFTLAASHPNYLNTVTYKLINIEIKRGKYAKARTLLNNTHQPDNSFFNYLFGTLENIECNYHQSHDYFSKSLSEPHMQCNSLLALAKLHIQQNNNDIARKMLETLELNPDYHIQAMFNLIYIYIIENDYEKAYNLYITIPKAKLSIKFQKLYNSIIIYLLYKLNRTNDIPKTLNNNTKYLKAILTNPNDDILLKHIQENYNPLVNHSNVYFAPDINLKEILSYIKEEINKITPSHSKIYDIYYFKLDNPIGYIDEEPVSDLCVTTIIGTKKIHNIKPVQLSQEFDKENLTHHKELKRTKGE